MDVPTVLICTPKMLAARARRNSVYTRLPHGERHHSSLQRERAALAWTEALTLITEGHVPDDIYELAKRSFSDEELVNLTLAVITISTSTAKPT
jgi:alkylhydroperoxidase family enzyme